MLLPETQNPEPQPPTSKSQCLKTKSYALVLHYVVQDSVHDVVVLDVPHYHCIHAFFSFVVCNQLSKSKYCNARLLAILSD